MGSGFASIQGDPMPTAPTLPAECEQQGRGWCSGGCSSVQFSAKCRGSWHSGGPTSGMPGPRGLGKAKGEPSQPGVASAFQFCFRRQFLRSDISEATFPVSFHNTFGDSGQHLRYLSQLAEEDTPCEKRMR